MGSHRGHLLAAIGVTDVKRQSDCIVAVQQGENNVPLVGGKSLAIALGGSIGEEITVRIRLPAEAGAFSPQLPPPCYVVLRGSVLSGVLAPVLRAPLEPDVISTVPPPLPCSTSLLQALEVLPRLEQVRPPCCVPPLCCVPVLPRVRRDAQASPDVRLPAAAADSCSPLSPPRERVLRVWDFRLLVSTRARWSLACVQFLRVRLQLWAERRCDVHINRSPRYHARTQLVMPFAAAAAVIVAVKAPASHLHSLAPPTCS